MTSEIQGIADRLEKVEKQNRRMNRCGLAVAVAATAILVMGQARPSRTVEADKFILRDAEGHARAELGMIPAPDGKSYRPSLRLLEASGNERLRIDPYVLDMHGEVLAYKDPADPAKGFEYVAGPNLMLSQTGLQITEGKSTDSAIFPFLSPEGNRMVVDLEWRPQSDASLTLVSADPKDGRGSKIELSASSQGPSVRVSDPTGFSALLGNASLSIERTGETHRTSAASLILFGGDGKVLWRAP